MENITDDEELIYDRSVVLEGEDSKFYILRDIKDDIVFHILKNTFEKNFKILTVQIPTYPITVTNIYFATTIA